MTSKTRPFAGKFKALFVPLAVLGLSACTQAFNADVQRFQSQLPIPRGQTFAVIPDNPLEQGGIEFGQYARLVEDKMARLGFVPVADPNRANLVVRFSYGIDRGRERIRSTGFGYRDPFFSPWYGYGRGYYGRGFGYGGFYGRPWGYGWYDPWFDNGIDSYTVYTSGIAVKIDSKAGNQRVFEGKAEAVSTSRRLGYLVPNLVEAMFTDFPGRNGETVRISIAPERTTVRPVR